MTPFLYRCPNTGKTVHGFSAEEVDDDYTCASITCFARRQVHLVNSTMGKVLGEDKE
jgi:hypothetical protein